MLVAYTLVADHTDGICRLFAEDTFLGHTSNDLQEKARLKFMYILMSTDMAKTYLKTTLSNILLTQLRSDIDLLFKAIDLSDFFQALLVPVLWWVFA
jgi:hypothetical protein